MSDVKSTTNLTAGLSGGGNESISDFYSEVTFLSPRPCLSPVAMDYQHQPIPALSYTDPRVSSRILDLLHPKRFKAVQRKRRPDFRTSLEDRQRRR